ncbi:MULTISPECIES: hypothetical protein [unclassified Solwaraspora]|uniref:hypothetical protein n=1 Tax=unclassified Solwaraspora TaxID=2627926 RepID=UPI00248AC9A6|nr:MULTISPECIES: hypothetical protein [unclassified Solwaraspora]WBB95760.1 hypothetical protein O7553_20650 [Solwaraspora sp. WMMA2059]WBC20336.1 hypothetical protein O7543_26730 [Solwaraspora sp. WMMA2080]WJK37513.1 hypothetical protein O7610_14855 [Solwaraspora sp. WMMA2065]
MDFWDLTKLLFRRWYIAAPLLLISVAAAGWTRMSVEPDYIATSYVQLIPPTAANTAPDEDAPTTPRNPWLELGLGSLSRAAALTVQDQAVLKQLDAAGLSESVAITLDNQQPIMTIEVVGESEEQATETTEEVVRRLEASVVGLQADYGANEESFITARRLDRGDNIQEANSKVNRAMIAVAGVGVLLSAALTIGIDGLLRRRRPRPVAAAPVTTGTDETITIPPMSGRTDQTRSVSRPQPVPSPRASDRDGVAASKSGGVYSSGNASQGRQESRSTSRPDEHRGAEPSPGEAPVAGSGLVGGPVQIGGPAGSGSLTFRAVDDRADNADGEASGSQLPTQQRSAGPQQPPQPQPATQQPVTPSANDETAVIRAVRDDATIILPKAGAGREQWTPSETSKNGSQAR